MNGKDVCVRTDQAWLVCVCVCECACVCVCVCVSVCVLVWHSIDLQAFLCVILSLFPCRGFSYDRECLCV